RLPTRACNVVERLGNTEPMTAPAFSPKGATSISARSLRMTFTTPAATFSGVTVLTPKGSLTPVSANIPASRTKPGKTTEAPTPDRYRSQRSPLAKPRSPNLVAEYSEVPFNPTLPDSEEI